MKFLSDDPLRRIRSKERAIVSFGACRLQFGDERIGEADDFKGDWAVGYMPTKQIGFWFRPTFHTLPIGSLADALGKSHERSLFVQLLVRDGDRPIHAVNAMLRCCALLRRPSGAEGWAAVQPSD